MKRITFFFRHSWSIVGKCIQETWGAGLESKDAKDEILESLYQSFIYAALNEMETVDIVGCLSDNFKTFLEEFAMGCVNDIPSTIKVYDQLEGIAGITLVNDRTNASSYSIIVRMLNVNPIDFLDNVIAYIE